MAAMPIKTEATAMYVGPRLEVSANGTISLRGGSIAGTVEGSIPGGRASMMIPVPLGSRCINLVLDSLDDAPNMQLVGEVRHSC